MAEAEARRRRQARISPIWVIPLLAVCVGGWLVFDRISSRGPTVTLVMPDAEGIEAGKTLIKTRNVRVGQVEEVELSEDLDSTLVRARLRAGTDRMLNSATRFWVVKPRIGRAGISGLNTVLSGAYIQLLPGDAEDSQRRFSVLNKPPVAPPDADGVRVELTSGLRNSVSAGDPVTYEGVTVGRVESVRFEQAKRQVVQQVFVEAPYDSLLTDTTRFWGASGINVTLEADGVSIDFESFETLIGGGLTFGVPQGLPDGEPVASGASFQVYASRSAAREGSFERHLDYVLLVEDSVAGLTDGSPVKYRGVRIGSVARVPWEFSLRSAEATAKVPVPVLIRIEPQRLGDGAKELEMAAWRQRFQRWQEQGLRATLTSSNLLTGQTFVDLNFVPDAEPMDQETFRGRPVMALASSGVARIQSQVTSTASPPTGTQRYLLGGSGTQQPATTQASSALRLAPVELAGYLRGDGIVMQTGTNTVEQATRNLWAEDLGTQLYRILRDRLTGRLPGHRVIASGESVTDDLPLRRLQVTVDRFQGRYDGQAVVAGTWRLVNRSGQRLAGGSFRQQHALNEDGFDALVRSLEQAWGAAIDDLLAGMKTADE